MRSVLASLKPSILEIFRCRATFCRATRRATLKVTTWHIVDSTEVVTSASLLSARHPTPSPLSHLKIPKWDARGRHQFSPNYKAVCLSINCHFLKMAMTMMSFPHPITRPHAPITQQFCLRLYFYGLPLSLMRVHVKDRPKIGELLQIYDNLLLAHLM